LNTNLLVKNPSLARILNFPRLLLLVFNFVKEQKLEELADSFKQVFQQMEVMTNYEDYLRSSGLCRRLLVVPRSVAHICLNTGHNDGE
jgi:hypothetical protein